MSRFNPATPVTVVESSQSLQSAIVNGGQIRLSQKVYDLGTSDMYIPDDTALIGHGSTLRGTGNVYIVGTESSDSVNLYEQNRKGQSVISVEKGHTFTVGDNVIIRGSVDEMAGDASDGVDVSQWWSQEAQKVRQQELHRITAIVDMTTHDELEFENDVLQVYALTEAYTEKPTVTKVTKVARNILLDGIAFDGIEVYVRVADNVKFNNCQFSIYNGRLARIDWDVNGSLMHGACRSVEIVGCKFVSDYQDVGERKALVTLCGTSGLRFKNNRLEGCLKDGLRLVGGASDYEIDDNNFNKIGRRSVSIVRSSKGRVSGGKISSGCYMQGIDDNMENLLLDHVMNVHVREVHFENTRASDVIELRRYAVDVTVEKCYLSIKPGGASSTTARRGINVHAWDGVGKAKNIRIIKCDFFLPREATLSHHYTAIRFDDPVDDFLFDGNTLTAEDPDNGRMHAGFTVGNAGGHDCYNWQIVNNIFNRGQGYINIRQDEKPEAAGLKIVGLVWQNNIVSAGSGTRGSDLTMINVDGGIIANSFFYTTTSTDAVKVNYDASCSNLRQSAVHYATPPVIANPSSFVT